MPVQATLIAERHVVFAVSTNTFGATPCLNGDQLFAILERGAEQLNWAPLASTTLPLASDHPPEIRLPAQTEPIHLALETATPGGRLAPGLPVLDSPITRMQAALDNNAIIAPVPLGTVLPDGLVTAEAEVQGLCTNAGTAGYPFRYSLGVLAIGDSSVAAIAGFNDLGDPEEYGLVRAHPPTEQR